MRTAVLILFIVLLTILAPSFSFAQNISTSSAIPKVEYELPYPGLLPDNPLYYLKAIRDNILKFLIRDPMKKAEFDLLQSDKRLGASYALLKKGNYDLCITTLSKSGNYFDDAIANIFKAKKQGEKVDQLLDRMITSSIKHQLVIREMQKGQKGDSLLNLRFQEARAHDFQERLEIIKSD
ncbi:MAG: hypothetical protein A3B38_03455 [Candidatus Levybacteria bacterium RIFCSPLOWO2_01_FULL_36_13]|nr:MAG: hypothetical protein A2684_00390 [Candidatus Levybacteria bacterium RIFCSPHIGHO2_01_FULL_36_15b]OGH34196.1 MAG: hypothetical protein A3B38_03455 [Candidatus Levybacteria bacterium RIFCSPLOWO2_01_FULL_36_13]